MTGIDYEVEYNNRARVPESPALMAGWARDAATYREKHAPRTASYGQGARNRIDFFAGDGQSSAGSSGPIVVFIHGGYWQRNSKDQFANLIAGPYARGWAAALPGYTLAPDASLTEIVAEINAALDWLALHGPAHGINGPVVLSGWSAGGHLTAMCLGHPLVRAGLAISGIFELGPLRDTYLDEKLRLTDEEIVALSPMRLPLVDKPLAITYGTGELPPLVSDSREYHARRSAAH